MNIELNTMTGHDVRLNLIKDGVIVATDTHIPEHIFRFLKKLDELGAFAPGVAITVKKPESVDEVTAAIVTEVERVTDKRTCPESKLGDLNLDSLDFAEITLLVSDALQDEKLFECVTWNDDMSVRNLAEQIVSAFPRPAAKAA